ncbi:MAG TPA: ATP-binding protein [Acidobacteriaceae bacterium]
MHAPDQLETSATATAPLRVLLVEDSEDDAHLLSRYFTRAGYQPSVRRVETADAMRAALNEPDAQWDVVIADFNLPSFSAPAALRLLKRMGRDLPFIIMSGAVSEETAVDAMRAGAHDYVSKQNLARLVPAIEREIREAGARRLKIDAERALRTSQQRFLRLVQAMPVGLIIAEADGVVRYANTTVERLLGYSEQELRSGAVALGSIFGSEAIAVLSRLRSVNASDSGRSFEALCRTSSNHHVPALIALAPLACENPAETPATPEQIAIFFVDLTEQKRTEEVVRRTEKLAATGQLAASIAHEINNPLEAVTNCLFLIGSGDLDSRSREFLRIAQQELDRVTRITTQTLRFYRQSSKPVTARINELLDGVIGLYEPRLRGLSIAVRRRYRQVPPVHAYEGEIRQVLANLIGNAIDAMQSDGGRLLLRSASARDPHTGAKGISVTVADTGCGMDAATRARIFEPFFSTKGTTGTGLGLWVSLAIIEKHCGRVSIRSSVRKHQGGPGGTVFRLFFPLRPASLDRSQHNP